MTDTINHILQHYGVLGVALGAGLEGETAVVLGGAIARHGVFSPYLAALAAWLGSFVADQIFFAIARAQRGSGYVRRIAAKPAFKKALGVIETRPMLFCIGFRFVYGFRIAGPIAIGTSQVPTRQFVLLNLMSAAIWAAIFTTIGYRFGKTFDRWLSTLLTPTHLTIAAGIVIVAGVTIFLIKRHRRARYTPAPS